ncbi:hypothetical protein [Streptomyces hiroshimensis]|uniref:DUF8017 domain-containing protein n=1 Tax=Streptomyces hiroshimensis TaxID=66424 RepID=A0ABQ2ZA15_9ACTN|nr:hypothetical protein [Streptomyces hiroshimensis]GGY05870.1 hypothetical protein GCM10010324_60930 [Streptomyces hiroshimensis]
MWPGQQPPGGEQNPQDSNPYKTPVPPSGPPSGAQPGYPQPNPYQQPPTLQQPNPYQQQPAGPPTPPAGQQWHTPAPAGAPEPPRDNRKRTTIIAITAAVAVVAAAVITGVVVLKDDDKENVAKNEPTKAPTAAPSSAAPSQSASESPEDNPRANVEVKPVIDGWKAVTNSKRHVVFDVPPEWKVVPPGTSIGFQDEDDHSFPPNGKGISMTGVAKFNEDRCEKSANPVAAGTKGAQGAKSEADAAENEALNWLFWGFDQKKTGKFNYSKGKEFKSDHGLTGTSSSATVTGIANKRHCASSGKSVTVTYKDVTGDLATWCLYSVTGTEDEVPDDTIKKIMSSLRPLKTS